MREVSICLPGPQEGAVMSVQAGNGSMPYPKEHAPTIHEVVSALGERKVVAAADAARYWSVEVEEDAVVPFAWATINRCAAENSRGTADWRCVYLHGFSLLELRERIGVERSHQPCFGRNAWWLNEEERSWAGQQHPGSYYLVDVHGRYYPRMSWEDQEAQVQKLGPRFSRAPEALLAAYAFSFFFASRERILERWYHWGPSQAENKGRVYIGDFEERGLELGTLPPTWRMDGTLRVCLVQPFDIRKN